MSTEQDKQPVLRWKEEIWNKRNVGAIFFAPLWYIWLGLRLVLLGDKSREYTRSAQPGTT